MKDHLECLSVNGMNNIYEKKFLCTYITFHMKDTKFKHGDAFIFSQLWIIARRGKSKCDKALPLF
ncbi:hypothetical protein CHI10_20770 [Bacillus sp. 7894-2]|nr:hypothetical protein CHI10_20770 [Bacillus sp. 7894-2]